MSRILLADDSPHAQRMGERILREEGFEVVTVTDGHSAMIRLADVDPDVVFADISLPSKSGYEICRELKSDPRFGHVRVVLTAGLLEPFDDEEARAVRCDGILKKPFEASVVVETIRPLVEAAQQARAEAPPAVEHLPVVRTQAVAPSSAAVPVRVVAETPPPASEPSGDIDPERVRAAVTLALDAAMPSMIDKITEQVLIALGH
ncbi:MAG: response regulator [Acidobacteria bacterium]|nr:response regulator [Acidobacteriota bacterium]MBI3282335.1 response regulator [Acidobacteriota bacterium]